MKLSKAQQAVLDKMDSEGLLLWTNEGRDYLAWLGSEDGTKVHSVNRRTAEILFDREFIKPTDHSNSNLFSYGLVKGDLS